MRSLIMIPLICAAAMATASDQRGTRDRIVVEKALVGKVAGEPRDCISRYDAQRSSAHNGLVLFRVSSKLVWKNDMQGCTVLREDDILQTNLYGSARLCRGDIAQVIDRGGHYGKGGCTFGEFVPYRKVG